MNREARVHALAGLRLAAEDGDGYAQYVLGALYRLGNRHPARLVERDDEKASQYLGNAATSGHLEAMAGMAELRLRQRQPREAMVWTQLLIHYQGVHAEMEGHSTTSNRAYEANLLKRCIDKLRPDDALYREVEAGMALFVERYDQAVRRGLQRWEGPSRELSRRDGRRLVQETPRHAPRPVRTTAPGRAQYLIAVDPRGRVERYFIVGSLPDQRMALVMQQAVDELRFNAIADEEPLRWALAPFELDDRSIRLRSE